MLRVTRHLYAVAALMFGVASMPSSAFAQILCIPGLTCPPADTTPPSVSITSPANGATVSGTINVSASASDNNGVAGVQFQLDGVNGGAEDTSAPYSIGWDTTATLNGTHTLTAVARDAAGNRTTSSPVTVTVSNGATPPPPPPSGDIRRFEENDPSVSLGAGWIQRDPNDWLAWSGGTAVQSTLPGARASFSFVGTSVTWIGYRSVDSGQARVFMDGSLVATIDLFARTNENQSRVYSVRGLASGSHVLTIEVAATRNTDSTGNIIVVDAFEIPAPVASHRQDTDPDMSFSGTWTAGDASKPWSGRTATLSSTAGSRATLPFNGTGIAWIGYRGTDAGIARVFIDGVLAGEVDGYFQGGPRIQAPMFTRTGLSDGNHTITIEVTGTKNPASTGTLVVVDAFDEFHVGTRFQDTDPSISYSSGWIQGNLNRSWSEGTISESDQPGATATFTFNGTGVTWIGCKKVTIGIARVFLDGVFQREIDMFLAPPKEAYQYAVFTVSGLAPGTHTLTIEATGQHNPAGSNAFVVIDAFDVRP